MDFLKRFSPPRSSRRSPDKHGRVDRRLDRAVAGGHGEGEHRILRIAGDDGQPCCPSYAHQGWIHDHASIIGGSSTKDLAVASATSPLGFRATIVKVTVFITRRWQETSTGSWLYWAIVDHLPGLSLGAPNMTSDEAVRVGAY